VARLLHHWIVISLILAASSGSSGQSTSSGRGEPAPPEALAANLPAAANATLASSYLFPDGNQQFRNYLYSTFGPPALISTTVGAALDQNKPAPPEWDSGAQGYGERYGWRFGMQIIGHTTEYSLAALVHEDVAYHRCECKGFISRGSHALSSTLTARTRSGGTIFSIPSLVGPYAGSFAAVNAWYPSRYEPADAFRIGSTSFLFKAVGNLIGEFIAPRR
jgi:hypothetical protein